MKFDPLVRHVRDPLGAKDRVGQGFQEIFERVQMVGSRCRGATAPRSRCAARPAAVAARALHDLGIEQRGGDELVVSSIQDPRCRAGLGHGRAGELVRGAGQIELGQDHQIGRAELGLPFLGGSPAAATCAASTTAITESSMDDLGQVGPFEHPGQAERIGDAGRLDHDVDPDRRAPRTPRARRSARRCACSTRTPGQLQVRLLAGRHGTRCRPGPAR